MSEVDRVKAVKEPNGFGGWLLVPLLQMIVNPILIFVGVVKFLSAARDTNTPPIAGGLYLMAAVEVVFVVYAAFCLARFTQAKKTIPFLMIGFYGVPIFESAIGLCLSSQEIFTLERRLAVAAIWISYFFLSRRVKNTFVN